MPSPVIWDIVFFFLLMGLLSLNLQTNHATIPLWCPLAFLLCEGNILTWVWQNGWNHLNRWAWLVSFVLVGCMLLQQSFGRRRWYIFHGGGFRRERESYELLAKNISQFLWLNGASPADVLFKYEGFLGLAPMSEQREKDFFKEIDQTLEDTKWCSWSLWHTMFAFQGVFMMCFLSIHALYMMGVF